MKAPFPWFGGKRLAAGLVWSRFGDVKSYVEPFAGSMATLLLRPHWPWQGLRLETVNDKDCYLANFWRALKADPDGVARAADWPVNEADLYARHQWLVADGRQRVERLRNDPDFYDVKVAGWWVWGVSQWLGRGWCGDRGKVPSQMPSITGPCGIHRPGGGDLANYFRMLANRLRRVQVCCGDWERVMAAARPDRYGVCGVFLDPPYGGARDAKLYAQESMQVSSEAREWALANGDDARIRIALCGYADEHAMPSGWECISWKAIGGFGNFGTGGNGNRKNERIWFSPGCLKIAKK